MARALFLLMSSALFAVVGLGCASAPPYRTHADLPREKPGIRVVGVLPPVIWMFEERAGLGLNKPVPHDEWSQVADEVVAKAFAEEMATDHVSVVPLGTDDPEVNEIAALSSAVDFSILRHAFEKDTGEMLPREPFDEQLRALDYSLGPATEFMERHHIDAIWIVRGFNLLPTVGARVKHGVDVALTVLSALGGVALPVIDLAKIQIRVALVDKSGRVLYYGVADRRAGPPQSESPAGSGAADPDSTAVDIENATYVDVDLRDKRAARHYLRAALSDYRTTGAP